VVTLCAVFFPESCELIATLDGHEASVSSLSLHSSGSLVLAVSSRDCVLWDLETFSRHKTLNGGQEVGMQDVSVCPALGQCLRLAMWQHVELI